MDSKTTIQGNKLMQLENSMLMYGIYNAETLKKLINTVHNIHNTTSSHERLFAGQQSSLTLRSLHANSLDLHYYLIILMLYLRTVQDKYIALYRELIAHQYTFTSAIRILAKGYISISLVTLSKLRDILNEVKTAIWETNPDYDLMIDRLHLYYDMQLVTFGIDKNKKYYNTISSICSTIHTMSTDTVSIRNSTSSHNRSEHTCTIFHTLTD